MLQLVHRTHASVGNDRLAVGCLPIKQMGSRHLVKERREDQGPVRRSRVINHEGKIWVAGSAR